MKPGDVVRGFAKQLGLHGQWPGPEKIDPGKVFRPRN